MIPVMLRLLAALLSLLTWLAGSPAQRAVPGQTALHITIYIARYRTGEDSDRSSSYQHRIRATDKTLTFGKRFTTSGGNPARRDPTFQQRTYDEGLGIYDYRNRSFDPATGRFLQRDPVIGGDTLYNPYVFPGNNPVGNVDPMGTDWKWSAEKKKWEPIPDTDPVPEPKKPGVKDGDTWSMKDAKAAGVVMPIHKAEPKFVRKKNWFLLDIRVPYASRTQATVSSIKISKRIPLSDKNDFPALLPMLFDAKTTPVRKLPVAQPGPKQWKPVLTKWKEALFGDVLVVQAVRLYADVTYQQKVKEDISGEVSIDMTLKPKMAKKFFVVAMHPVIPTQLAILSKPLEKAPAAKDVEKAQKLVDKKAVVQVVTGKDLAELYTSSQFSRIQDMGKTSFTMDLKFSTEKVVPVPGVKKKTKEWSKKIWGPFPQNEKWDVETEVGTYRHVPPVGSAWDE